MKNKAYRSKFDQPSGAIAAIRMIAVLNLIFGVLVGLFFLSESSSPLARNSYFGTIGIVFILEGVLGWAILTVLCSLTEKFYDISRDISKYVKFKNSIEFNNDGLGTKKCPLCMESIKFEALKCRFCGRIFDYYEVSQEVEKRKKELSKESEGIKQCLKCVSMDIKTAIIEDGSLGDWCPHCKISIQKMSI